MTGSTAFLFDVDNTLLDNDQFEDDLHATLESMIGADGAALYWAAFEARRDKLGYADYIGAMQQGWEQVNRDPRWLAVGEFLLEYPFVERLFPQARDVLDAFSRHGPTWLISDGDGVMQPRKLRRAGLWDAVNGRVRVYIHKENMLADIEEQCRARHYVLIDDKLRILDMVKKKWGDCVTTVQPRQGHYAASDDDRAATPDIVVGHIADLLNSRLLS